MNIEIRRFDSDLPVPTRARSGDAGLDLRARHAVKLAPGERAVVATGIAVAIPDGYAGLVVPRSGLAADHGLSVVNGPGLIDSGYRGEVAVILVNLGDKGVVIERGDRIAQLVVVAVPEVVLHEVTELPASARGDAGFGSSGSN